jgi:hypothetical protein
MSSTTIVSSEDSTCTMPKQPRMEDEDSFNITDDIDISFDYPRYIYFHGVDSLNLDLKDDSFFLFSHKLIPHLCN